MAAYRGQGDLVLGNIAGSNIFNILCILGITGLLTPLGRGGDAILQDLWVMIGFSLVLASLLHRGQTLFRTEAALLLAAYAVYVYVLF
jgi:cation:H+ antiporter